MESERTLRWGVLKREGKAGCENRAKEALRKPLKWKVLYHEAVTLVLFVCLSQTLVKSHSSAGGGAEAGKFDFSFIFRYCLVL